ncbi:Flavonoid 3'-monooxygenase [Triticum urartu]|uniref:Flavonoid 3'-monooxygenase n=1 Tax=Triticum urartu TaxID=4572 RepID=M8ALW5_TRIUA|nr:Flavonoid 3'-monooxygenase [Triticum urartu]
MDIPLPLLLSTLAVAVGVCYVLATFFRADKGRAPLPPGPRGWPVLGNLPQLGGKTHQTMHEMSKVYGPVLRLRFGSSVVVVAGSAGAAEQFLRTHDAKFSSRPPNSGGEHMAYNYQDVVFAPYGPRWRAMRKVCAVNLFSARALDDLRGVREREAARPAQFKEIVLEVMEVGGVLNVGDFVPALRWLAPQGVVARLKKLHRRFDDMMNWIIAERRAGGSTAGEEKEGKDLLGLLLAMVQEDKSLTGGEEDRITDTDVKALILLPAGQTPDKLNMEEAFSLLLQRAVPLMAHPVPRLLPSAYEIA